MLSRRWAWFEGQVDLDPERLFFVDESWASTNMTRRYGRSPRGENAFGKLKALLRRQGARTSHALWSAIGRLIDLVIPAECVNMFAAAGYDPEW